MTTVGAARNVEIWGESDLECAFHLWSLVKVLEDLPSSADAQSKLMEARAALFRYLNDLGIDIEEATKLGKRSWTPIVARNSRGPGRHGGMRKWLESKGNWTGPSHHSG